MVIKMIQDGIIAWADSLVKRAIIVALIVSILLFSIGFSIGYFL